MTVMFSIHTGTTLRKFTVRGLPSATGVGAYWDGESYLPDLAALAEALPYNWRKAYARSGSFWFSKNAKVGGHGDQIGTGTMTLRDRRGEYITTLYAIPFYNSALSAARLEAQQKGLTEYKYANSILWGDTYSVEDGMHHIFAGSDVEAFNVAIRADKCAMGLRFLYRKQPDGSWKNCGDE